MITSTVSVFPNNIVDSLYSAISDLDSDLRGYKRPLRASDPAQSFGIFGQQWQPNNDSFEMRGAYSPGPTEPTLGKYLVAIQAFVKDTDEERGLATHSVLSKMIRDMLYRDADLRVELAALTVATTLSAERTQRFGISAQRYFSNEIAGDFLYLSTIEFWLETETI